MKKVVAIIGATETEGKEFAIRLAGAGTDLLLISHDADLLPALKQTILALHPDTAIDTMNCVKDGCWEADIIVLTVPEGKIRNVVDLMKEVATQKIVVSTTESGRSLLEDLLPYSKLVFVSEIFSPYLTSIEGKDISANTEIASLLSCNN